MDARQLGRHRWSWPLGLALLVMLPAPMETANGACAAPYLFVDKVQRKTTIRASTEVIVSGRAFVRGCNDSMGVNAFGCESRPREPESPMHDVALVLRQDQRRWHLGRTDTRSVEGNQRGHITWNVRVPAVVQPGPAVLVADVPPHGPDGLDARLKVTVTDR